MSNLKRQFTGRDVTRLSRLKAWASSAVLTVLASLPANASMGGYHQCSTATGEYKIDFIHGSGHLVEAGSETPHSFTELGRTLLESRKSKCQSKASAQTFDITQERYILQVRLRDGAPSSTELYLYCEHYWDSSPASACEQDTQQDLVVQHLILVPTYKDVDGRQERTEKGRSYWDHNGSVMYLVAQGDRRQFFYSKPRRGMLQAGAHEGSLLFDGETDGRTYEGTAFIFNRRCGQYPYRVAGPIKDDGRGVLLRGRAPRVDGDCRVYGYRDDELEFILMPNR